MSDSSQCRSLYFQPGLYISALEKGVRRGKRGKMGSLRKTANILYKFYIQNIFFTKKINHNNKYVTKQYH